jgi:pSer/pThr/pTyr-binding forkhead associated (FHA) protein
MKLVFPNGEHATVLLSMGVNRVGSDAEGVVVIAHPSVQPRHFEIHVTGTGANLQLPDGSGPVTVNGKPVKEMMALRTGDLLGFGVLTVKFVVAESAKTMAGPSPLPASVIAAAKAMAMDGDTGATRIRAAPPKFVLRGVSGAIFGKMYGVTGPMTIGRSAECDIAIPVEEISRRHALVKPNPQGLYVEDVGSSNGTYINNKRVQTGQLLPGDELRLDQVRLILVAPGMEIQQMQQKPAETSTASAATPDQRALAMKVLAGAVIVASIAFIAWLLVGR